MTAWRERPVTELCTHIIDCVNKTAPSVEKPSPFKMLRTTNVRNGWVDTSKVRYVTKTTFERWTRRMRPRRGDIILTREAPLGEVGVLRTDEAVFLGQRLVMYRPDESECDPRFLMYSMLGPTVQAELRSLGSGATVEHLRVPDCERLMIPCPSPAVQKRIGAVLGSLDDLIDINRRRIEVLEDMARTIYREWFVDFRFPGHEAVRLIHSECGLLPEDWSVSSVAAISAAVTRGISPKYADDGAWLVINQKCIRNERVSLDKARKQERQVPDVKQVKPGDVLINSTGVGTLGRVAMYLGAEPNLTVDSHVTIARPVDPSLNPWYGMTLVSRRSEFERLGTGSTGQTELSRHDVGSQLMAVPATDIRSAFADHIWPLLNTAKSLLAVNEVLSRTRDHLLPKLVTGQLDVSRLDLNDLIEVSVA
ncbi:restriction endonuclease subunit S [Mycobacterium kansasii]